MKTILLFGAGKSATCLIDYLLTNAAANNWQLLVVDNNFLLAERKVGNSPHAKAIAADITDSMERDKLVATADIVISMLPPALHILVANSCLQEGRHLLTASYVDDSIKKLHTAIEKKGVLFLCEMGLDPGIDHMSAMQIIHDIKKRGGSIISFHSHCGGLVAPESDDNPWHYKISWNPRNVVLAGKAGAIYKKDGKQEHCAYEHLFINNAEVEIPGIGNYAWYPNRDSLTYAKLYQLEEAATFVRTTLRHPDFYKGWSRIVELGLTNESESIDTNDISYADFASRFLKKAPAPETPLQKVMLGFLGLYDTQKIGRGKQTAANIMQYLLETKLMLQSSDKDMIIMLHEFVYLLNDKEEKMGSYMVVKGEDNLKTAMAKTVGLPLAIAAKLILQNKITLRGVHIPVLPEIYDPVLYELNREGISFNEF